MAKKLAIDGNLIGTIADNVEYANAGMSGVSSAKGALDNLQTRLSTVENEGVEPASSAPVIVVYGDSTASDKPSNNNGRLAYHAQTNIFKHIARISGASSYSNSAIHGGVLSSSLIADAANTRTDADYVFILIGINNVSQSGSVVGDIDTVMAADSGDSSLGNTLLGMYRQMLEALHARCQNAKIVAITPLFNQGSATSTKLATFCKGIEIMCNRLGGVANRYVFVDAWSAGITSATYSAYYVDGTHPNDRGALFYAHYIYLWSMVYPSDGVNYPESPTALCTPTSLSIDTTANTPNSATVTISGKGTGNLSLQVIKKSESAAVSMFSINKSTITANTNKDAEDTITVTFNNSSAGTHEAYLKIIPARGTWFYMELSGTVTA